MHWLNTFGHWVPGVAQSQRFEWLVQTLLLRCLVQEGGDHGLFEILELYSGIVRAKVIAINVPPAKFDKNELYRRPEFEGRIPDAPVLAPQSQPHRQARGTSHQKRARRQPALTLITYRRPPLLVADRAKFMQSSIFNPIAIRFGVLSCSAALTVVSTLLAGQLQRRVPSEDVAGLTEDIVDICFVNCDIRLI
ncbi:hypothetical protein OG21DRAFT_1605081 [Imleria badia]|nr:hypothetical protein OG21DRAFT_1605081 [Imleria badia]